MNYLLPERLDRLAREYALGTLHGPARRRFERVLRQSPAAGLAVGVWQERLGGLSASLPPLAPRETVWRGLEQRLFADASRAPSASRWARLVALLSGRTMTVRGPSFLLVCLRSNFQVPRIATCWAEAMRGASSMAATRMQPNLTCPSEMTESATVRLPL